MTSRLFCLRYSHLASVAIHICENWQTRSRKPATNDKVAAIVETIRVKRVQSTKERRRFFITRESEKEFSCKLPKDKEAA
jgi:hypothetical protein